MQLFHKLDTQLRAQVAKYLVTREIVKLLKPLHAEELSRASYNVWPSLRAKHTAEIQAVREGRLHITDRIVDRRTWANPYLPESVHRLQQPILKNTPYNIRRFSETPIPRRAINLIKNAIVALPWKIVAMEDVEITPDIEKRTRIATRNLNRPNNSDSWKSLIEQVVEDIVVGGFGSIEPRLTPHFERPFKLWAVDGSTIRIYPNWTESQPDKPHYAQMTGLKGERGFIDLRDDELIYIRDNIRSNTPFGLGKLEVSFTTINAFLGAQDMSSKSGSNQIFKKWMWWKNSLNPGQISTVERHLRNEEEGQAHISMISGIEKPEIIDTAGVAEADLLLGWQEFCIRIIAQGFDLSPFALGLERDVNRSTGEVMAATDFKAAVFPVAKKLEEALTRYLLHRLLGWKDLEFKFIGLEDPDLMTKLKQFTMLYTIDGITSDEIREDIGRTKDPSGMGRLFNSQKALIQIEATAKVQANQQATSQAVSSVIPPASGNAGSSKPPGTLTAPKPPKVPTGATPAATGPMRGSVFHALHILAMGKDELKKASDAKLIPKKVKDIKDAMEEQVPGILQHISEELQEYFEYIDEEEDELTVSPDKVTSEDEAEQISKFKKRELPKEKKTTEKKYLDGRNKNRDAQNS